MNERETKPVWAGPRFDLDDAASPPRSQWRTARRLIVTAMMIGCFLLAVQESFRWLEQRAKRLKLLADQAAANKQPALVAPVVPLPADKAPVVVPAPIPENVEAFHAEALRRHRQFHDQVEAQLDGMRQRHEAFRARARQRHEDFMRRHELRHPPSTREAK